MLNSMTQNKICGNPGCSKLVPIGTRYCNDCAKKKTKQYEQNRNTEWQHLYGSKWQHARKSFLSQHPLCAECLKGGTTKAANVVDHIIPHKGNINIFWNVSNWQSLCKRCHDKKTATEGAFGNDRPQGNTKDYNRHTR
jgi:5-methylcytosine-specific restriction protein A